MSFKCSKIVDPVPGLAPINWNILRLVEKSYELGHAVYSAALAARAGYSKDALSPVGAAASGYTAYLWGEWKAMAKGVIGEHSLPSNSDGIVDDRTATDVLTRAIGHQEVLPTLVSELEVLMSWKLSGADTDGRHLFLTFVIILRMQPEALPARRAFVTDDPQPRADMEHKALLGIRSIDGHPRLIPKLRVRRNMPYRTILMRPCFRSVNVLVGRGIFPALPSLLAYANPARRSGRANIHSIQNKSLSRILKADIHTLDMPSDNRYATYCFCSGAVMGTKSPGETQPRIMATAGWNRAVFRSYIALRSEGEAFITALLKDIEDCNDSDPEAVKNSLIAKNSPRNVVDRILSRLSNSQQQFKNLTPPAGPSRITYTP